MALGGKDCAGWVGVLEMGSFIMAKKASLLAWMAVRSCGLC